MFSASAKPSLKAMNLWIRQWLSSWPLLPPEPPLFLLMAEETRHAATFDHPTGLKGPWRTFAVPGYCHQHCHHVYCHQHHLCCSQIWLNVGIYNSGKWSLCNHSLWFKFKHPDTFILIFGQFLGKREKCYTCTFDDQTALVLRHKLTNCLSCHHSIMIIWS